jgi:glycosyltransferase involved in cell wall biosynthesis
MIDISVLIPTYNRGDLIGETLDSILCQTLPPKEVIVVDDGSQDDTALIISKYNDKIRYLRQDNAGQCVARATGLEHATSSWIALCDSDDIWLPQHLEKLAAAVSLKPNASLYCSNFHYFSDHIWPTAKFDTAPHDFFAGSKKLGDGDFLYHDGPFIDRILKWQPIFQSAMLFTKAQAISVGGFDPRFARTKSEDLDFTLRLCAQSGIIFSLKPLVKIRRHERNDSAISWQMLEGEVDILRHALKCYDLPHSTKQLLLSQIKLRSLGAGEGAFAAGDTDRAYHHFSEIRWDQLPTKAKIKKFISRFPKAAAQPIASFLCGMQSNQK